MRCDLSFCCRCIFFSSVLYPPRCLCKVETPEIDGFCDRHTIKNWIKTNVRLAQSKHWFIFPCHWFRLAQHTHTHTHRNHSHIKCIIICYNCWAAVRLDILSHNYENEMENFLKPFSIQFKSNERKCVHFEFNEFVSHQAYIEIAFQWNTFIFNDERCSFRK